MPRLKLSNTWFLAFFAITTPAMAYNPQWLECTGQVIITPVGGAAVQEAVKDIYVYDSDAHNLFMYSEDRKRLSALGAKAESDQEIRWSSWDADRKWEGRLNRADRTLTLSYRSDKESREWRETCKPTTPKPEA